MPQDEADWSKVHLQSPRLLNAIQELVAAIDERSDLSRSTGYGRSVLYNKTEQEAFRHLLERMAGRVRTWTPDGKLEYFVEHRC